MHASCRLSKCYKYCLLQATNDTNCSSKKLATPRNQLNNYLNINIMTKIFLYFCYLIQDAFVSQKTIKYIY